MMSTGAYDTLWHVEANCKSECISWFYLALYKLSWRHIIVYAHFLITYTQFSRSVMSDSLWFHGLKHARLPCPSPAPGACSNSCPLSQWCHSTISFSVVPFSSCLQPFLASGSFPMSNIYIILLFNPRKQVISLMFPLISEKTKAYKDSESCL